MEQLTGLVDLKKQTNKIIGILVLIVAAFFSQDFLPNNAEKESIEKRELTRPSLEELYNTRSSGEIITITGKVVKLLADDLEGSKHQKLILKVANMTILLAHNIDVAPRVPVRAGESITIKGEYEWNKQGGVIHWTHRDKSQKHPDGWVKHNNKKYY